MSRYLPLNLKWRFKTEEGRKQFRSLFYRIYINIFAIFFRIPLLPLEIDKYGIHFYYSGDTLIWKYPWRRKNNNDRWISYGFSGTGEFGDAIFCSLSEIDKSWDEYFKANQEISERIKKDYQFKKERGLCTDLLCDIPELHKHHE